MPSATYKLYELPYDVLLRMISFLDAQSILRLRQVCWPLSELTKERTVWTTCYRNSQNFLPPVSITTQSSADLERLIVRAARLDSTWFGLTSPEPLRKRELFIPSRGPGLYIKLLRGRYLVCGYLHSFCLFDIDAGEKWNLPLFSLNGAQNIAYHSSDGYEGEQYLAVLRESNGNGSRPSQICIGVWRLDLNSGEPTLAKVVDVPLNTTKIPLHLHFAFGGDYLFFSGRFFPRGIANGEDIYLIHHLPSNTPYHLPPDCYPNRTWWTDALITSRHFVLISPVDRNTSFQVFSLPEVPQATTQILPRTHCALTHLQFTEPHLLSLSSDKITFVVTATRSSTGSRISPQLQILDLLLPSSSAHSEIKEGPICPPGGAYDLRMTIASASRARISSLSSSIALHKSFTVYDVDRQEGECMVTSQTLAVDEMLMGADYVFDGFRGRFCVVVSNEEVAVIDYVDYL